MTTDKDIDPMQEALEAAARAIAKRHNFGDKSPYIPDAQAALTAAFASLEKAGFVLVERRRVFDLKDAPRKDWSDEVHAIIAAARPGA